jgi:hypothetical protein
MLEQDGKYVQRAIDAGGEYWAQVNSCLVRYFDYPLDEVDLKVRQVQEQLTLIETKNDKFNPLMKYHADPFDVAARVAGTAPGEKEYESNLPRYLANRSIDSKDKAL